MILLFLFQDVFSTEEWSGNWGMFKVCLKVVIRDETKNLCKSPEPYPGE